MTIERGASSLLEFPCDFPLKVMGAAAPDFADLVAAIVRRHVYSRDDAALVCRHSSGGRYVSVTVTVKAMSQTQLDGLYTDLSRHERVLMVL
jgi:putative lipoic acid-binding regulatory protein